MGGRPADAIIREMIDREANVEVLFISGCPHVTAALCSAERVIRESRRPADIVLRRIGDPDEARRERFLGSPSIRVGGRDIEPGAECRSDYGLGCRLYRSPGPGSGESLEGWLREALLTR